MWSSFFKNLPILLNKVKGDIKSPETWFKEVQTLQEPIMLRERRHYMSPTCEEYLTALFITNTPITSTAIVKGIFKTYYLMKIDGYTPFIEYDEIEDGLSKGGEFVF